MSDIGRQAPLTATPGPRVETYTPGAWTIFAAVTLFMTGGFNILFGIASAFPLLAILVIALDVVILYQLTVGWSRSIR